MPNFFNKSRIIYFFSIVLIICLGLSSRKINFIPLFVGDILWATMIFFIVRCLLLNMSIRAIAFISILICFSVEFSQLYQAEWINVVRHTLPGRLILGQGFLWSDLIAYIAGVFIAIIVDAYLIVPVLISKNERV
jgi:hypothetical protein